MHTVLAGKPEVRIPFGRLWCRWADNIRIDFRETVRAGMD